MESTRKARAKCADRDSEEGRRAHCYEEAERRARRVLGRVGDHRCPEKTAGLQGGALATKHAATEVEDVRSVPPVSDALPEAVEKPEPVEWVLVAWPEVLRAARRRLGSEATCPFCGRRGLIGRVVSVDEWRRYIRRGLEPGP